MQMINPSHSAPVAAAEDLFSPNVEHDENTTSHLDLLPRSESIHEVDSVLHAAASNSMGCFSVLGRFAASNHARIALDIICEKCVNLSEYGVRGVMKTLVSISDSKLISRVRTSISSPDDTREFLRSSFGNRSPG